VAVLTYVGVDPAAAPDVENRTNVDVLLNAGVSRVYVDGRVEDTISGVVGGQPRATKSYVDGKDSSYASTAYYGTQDALLVPNSAKGTANGVASLSGGKIPQAQVPVLGVGILRGPFPVSHTFAGTTFDIPFKIADWALGTLAIYCQPWVFMAVGLKSVGGRPVVEVRAGTPAQTTYASQTLVACGYGRSFYHDFQTVEVFPTDSDLGEGQDGVQDSYPPTMDMTLTAWMYDDGGGQTTLSTGLIFNASAFLARTAL
jgi:hypothetical protein